MDVPRKIPIYLITGRFNPEISKILEQLRLRSNSINLRHGVLKVYERTTPITF